MSPGYGTDLHVSLHTKICTCAFVYMHKSYMPICGPLHVHLRVRWGMVLLWTENIPPSHSLPDPAASLPTAICFFTPHSAALTPFTQTRAGRTRACKRREAGEATRGEPALVQLSEALLIRVTDLR